MIGHTKAYNRLRKQAEGLFDFVVLVCYAIPSLKELIQSVEEGRINQLATPDHFPLQTTTPEELKNRADVYKGKLGNNILISSFSYFEAYVIGAVNEIISFHGGPAGITEMAEKKASAFVQSLPPNLLQHKRKLQEYPKKGKHQKYMKHSNELKSHGYRFPGELLSAYGVRSLIQRLKNLKAKQIPDLLRHALLIDISDADVQRFESIRNDRNQIAHGKSTTYHLRKAIKANRDLRQLALRVDQQIVQQFFVIEKYS